MNLEQLKYPIGHFQKPEAITAKHLTSWTATIAEFPQKIAALTNNLDKTHSQKRTGLMAGPSDSWCIIVLTVI